MPVRRVFLLPRGTGRYSRYVLVPRSDAGYRLKYPNCNPVYDVSNRETSKLTFPNPSSRSSSSTRLTWSVAHHIQSTSFLPPVQESSRQVPTSEDEAFAQGMNFLFIETSAKTAVGVGETFREVVEKILDTPELLVLCQPAGAGGDSKPDNLGLDSNERRSQRSCACQTHRFIVSTHDMFTM